MARNRRQSAKPATEVNFSSLFDARTWFTAQPREVAVTMAVRAALRSLPQIASGLEKDNFLNVCALALFRSCALSWTAAVYPAKADQLASAIYDARTVAVHAGSRNIGFADSVRHAAYSASDAALTAVGASNAANETITLPAYEGPSHSAAYALEYSHSALGVRDITGAAAANDAAKIEVGKDAGIRADIAVDLAKTRVWPNGTLDSVSKDWNALKAVLLSAGDDWDVWVRWYEDRLNGRPSVGEGFDIAVATLPDELWKQGPKAVNARIKELIAEHTPPESIPAQGPGPHFALSPDLKIVLAPPTDLDAEGNNLGRIGQLLPVLRQAASDLAGHLNPNTQPEISRNLSQYRAAITDEPEAIAWGLVFGLGVRLDNAAAAARREIADRLQEPLEDAAEEALDTVLALHGPLILATKEGRELTDESDRFQMTRTEQEATRNDAQAIARELQYSPDIIEQTALGVVIDAVEVIGEGRHPERSSTFGLIALRHAATIFIPAASLASLIPVGAAVGGIAGGAFGAGVAWAGYETFKKSGVYSASTAALGPAWDHLHSATEAQFIRYLVRLGPYFRFARAVEQPLRRLAGRAGWRWMTRYIDFITRTNPPKE